MIKEIRELMLLFRDCFINMNNELILVPKTNLYFRLDDVNNIDDLKYKIVAWCSRDASKSIPYKAEWRNERYREYVRNNINTFLGLNYTEDEWLEIYAKFGNGCNKERCIEFIRNNFNLKTLRGENETN